MEIADELAAGRRRVHQLGRDAGFDLVRVARAEPMHLERSRMLAWLEAGRAGEMRWLTPEHAVRSTEPEAVMKGVRSVISVALAYWSGPRTDDAPERGQIARYAWGADYHRVLEERLRALAAALAEGWGGEHRWFVDTGPTLDKAYASRSGVGWTGKNTNVLTEPFGSFVLLGELLTTLPLEPDAPLDRTCGSCRLCVVACPTGALDTDYSIDSRRCISYLTIEHRGPIPPEYRPAMRDWVFGCDICQDVCPPTMATYLADPADRKQWASSVREVVTRRAATIHGRPGERRSTPLVAELPRQSVDLYWLLSLSQTDYLEAFRDSPIRRAKVWMLRRNAAVGLGNVGSERAVGALTTALRTDEHAVVRGHAAWALGELATRHSAAAALRALAEALSDEQETSVRAEIEAALRRHRANEPEAGSPVDV